MRKIVVFDIDGKLDKFSPHLNSECSDGFLIFSPAEINKTAWRECCNLVHYCIQHQHMPIEFWFLYEIDEYNNNDYNVLNLNDYLGSDLLNNIPSIIKDSLRSGLIKIKPLVWLPLPLLGRIDSYTEITYSVPYEEDISYLPPVVIKTLLNPHNQTNIANRFMLPMALVFLKYQNNILGHVGTVNLYQELYLKSSQQILFDAVSYMQQYYQAVRDFIGRSDTYDRYVYNLDNNSFYSLNIAQTIETQLPEFIINDIDISYFYHPILDERKVEEWFDSEIKKTLASCHNFETKLNEDYENCLAALNQVQQQQSIQQLANSLDGNPKLKDFESNSNQKKLSCIKSIIDESIAIHKQTLSETEDNNHFSRHIISFEKTLKDWQQNNREVMIDTLRLRPTTTVLYVTLVSSIFIILFILLYATNNTSLLFQPITYLPIQYQYLIPVLLISLFLMIVISLILLLIKHRRTIDQYNKIKANLANIHNSIIIDSQSEINARSKNLQIQMLGKNRNLIENIEKYQKNKDSKYSYFKTNLINYIKYCYIPNNNEDFIIYNINENNYYDINPLENIIFSSELGWRGSSPQYPTIKQGNQIINPSIQHYSILNKLIGVESIELK
ncbi:hypothetical protein [Psychrobacter sp. I-STPA10]|uniref:hypothetical protein n=1 Tax=Psychrobacter sp. I-STPA10 TaxID=2585769 RepID=UPI001E39507E|nr:hypothetical protein [Psychrobacter sp. I-STPA10]